MFSTAGRSLQEGVPHAVALRQSLLCGTQVQTIHNSMGAARPSPNGKSIHLKPHEAQQGPAPT